MADTTQVALITGGALVLSQALNILYTFFNDKRKDKTEISKLILQKKIEVGENFYHMIGENLQLFDLSTHYHQMLLSSASEEGLKFFQEKQELMKNNIDKIRASKETFNLVELYYNISTTFEEVSKTNIITLTINANIIETQECFKKSDNPDEKAFLQIRYRDEMLKLISHCMAITNRLRMDLDIIKKDLRGLISSYK